MSIHKQFHFIFFVFLISTVICFNLFAAFHILMKENNVRPIFYAIVYMCVCVSFSRIYHSRFLEIDVILSVRNRFVCVCVFVQSCGWYLFSSVHNMNRQNCRYSRNFTHPICFEQSLLIRNPPYLYTHFIFQVYTTLIFSHYFFVFFSFSSCSLFERIFVRFNVFLALLAFFPHIISLLSHNNYILYILILRDNKKV